MPSTKDLYQKYLTLVRANSKDQASQDVFESLLNGRNEYIRLTTRGSSSFDPTWIDIIEDCLFDLGDIVNNPWEVTKQESSVTPIELAKKVDAESVQHLASHSQYIKEIDEKGNVVPSKILSHSNVEDFMIYENRFIATFIRRLILFIEKRYDYIHEKVSLTKDDVLIVKNKSNVNGTEVEIETKITVKKEETDDMSKQAREYIRRIEVLREYVSYYYNSRFMKLMKNEKDVRRPIIQTNILRKNPKYRKCYETFLFIERFSTLGVSFKVTEDFQSFNEQERRNLNFLLVASFLSVGDDEQFESIKKETKVYKPRFLKSIDDEEYVYGDFSHEPIEYVRVDKAYRDYLNKKLHPLLPLHPTKFEKVYYHDEYTYRKSLKEYQKELDHLLARKAKAQKEFEKLVQARIAKRDKEEALARQRQLELQLQIEDDLIEKKRQEIIAAAKLLEKQEKIHNKPKKAKKEEVLPPVQPIVEEIQPEQPAEPIKEEPIPEPVVEEPKVEETPVVEPVVEQPLEENKEEPVQETPAVEPQPIEEVQPEPASNEETPIIEETPKEEVLEEPVQEEKVEEVQPVIEEAPILEKSEPVVEQPVQEEVQEEPILTEEKVENKPVIKKKAKKAPAKKAKKVEPKEEVKEEPVKEKAKPIKKAKKAKAKAEPKPEPIPEPAPVVEEVKPEPEPVVEEKEDKPVRRSKERDIPEVIPGRFIVKTPEGYYINEKKISQSKGDAHIFLDFNKAVIIKKRFGGKVIKL